MTPTEVAFDETHGQFVPAGPRSILDPHDIFLDRHIGPNNDELVDMAKACGFESVDALIDATVPDAIRMTEPLKLGQPQGEYDMLARLKDMSRKNKVYKSFIGMGYHGTIIPPVILRKVLENPRWYTPYTPYQAEIAQGRLEALLNFQTMVSDLTGLPLAGASLLDEGTAAAEAMAMCHGIARGKRPIFIVAEDVHPQTIAVLQTRCESMGVELRVARGDQFELSDQVSGVLVQYPNTWGQIKDYDALTRQVHDAGALLVCATDLLALTLLKAPGEFNDGKGADIAIGSSQRFGVPMGYGGPHAAFLATKETYARKMPGRIIGVSKDVHGNTAFRMSLQTREQHIRRDKATSNICTAQVLLAIIAGFYAVYHGPNGLKHIATRVHAATRALVAGLTALGRNVKTETYFDTIVVEVSDAEAIHALAAKFELNLRRIGPTHVGIALDETTTRDDLAALLTIFNRGITPEHLDLDELVGGTEADELVEDLGPFARTSDYLTHEVFNRYHSESELLRYAVRLCSKDISLADSMIPLGSCTMKLNAASEMIPVTWPEFANLHPFAPADQTLGYKLMFMELENWLSEITGFAACSLQPNAGSQGEYAGLMLIRKYHEAQAAANTQDPTPNTRDICLIPVSAHGTNPASAVIAGMKVVPVNCKDNGDIDLDHLKQQAEAHSDELAALMVTYPSTHGVFETEIREICDVIHDHGGKVYMDGANMNAQVGLTSPGLIGADVCHLNLHKTFCIPHGGGGPGMGPICCTEDLAPYLPSHPMDTTTGGRDPFGTVSAAPYGSPAILPISWMYIAMMGAQGLTDATKAAIVNANYMAARLKDSYDVLYTGQSGTVAHEFILDVRRFQDAGVTIDDFAKRLMDFGFHSPTMSWPVAGTLMFEPTESESKEELDRFCDAMIQIRAEIAKVEKGDWPQDDNPLHNAPHTAKSLLTSDWQHPYTREEAAYALPYLREHKYWPLVGRIDNAHGDRNLICTCPPMEDYCEM
ncbi:MAG: aminomethyl-transferring glycine dehydrogenase [Planctomycetota bacterium]